MRPSRLFVYGLTTTARSLVASNATLAAIPASTSNGIRGKRVDVTNELWPNATVDPVNGVSGGRSSAELSSVDSTLRATGFVWFEWSGTPLYKTDGLMVGLLADPGTGTALPVHSSGTLAITTAAAETNTLADPTFVGQRLALICQTYAVGDRVVTAASAINQAGNTIMTFGAAADMIVLEAMLIAGALKWRVTANDGVALS